MEWELVPREEQETIINIDYFEKTINVYTTRKAVADRLLKKIGKPTLVHKNGNSIWAVEYNRSLFDADVSKFFSKILMVGAFKNANDEEYE